MSESLRATVSVCVSGGEIRSDEPKSRYSSPPPSFHSSLPFISTPVLPGRAPSLPSCHATCDAL